MEFPTAPRKTEGIGGRKQMVMNGKTTLRDRRMEEESIRHSGVLVR